MKGLRAKAKNEKGIRKHKYRKGKLRKVMKMIVKIHIFALRH